MARVSSTAATASVPVKPVTIGALSDKLFALREEKRELTKQIDDIDEQYRATEAHLIERLDAEGTDKGAGRRASVSVSVTTVANVTDWDAFWAYAKRNNYAHLFQRRVSDPAVRELWEAGKKVPGAEPFSKKKLNVRSI